MFSRELACPWQSSAVTQTVLIFYVWLVCVHVRNPVNVRKRQKKINNWLFFCGFSVLNHQTPLVIARLSGCIKNDFFIPDCCFIFSDRKQNTMKVILLLRTQAVFMFCLAAVVARNNFSCVCEKESFDWRHSKIINSILQSFWLVFVVLNRITCMEVKVACSYAGFFRTCLLFCARPCATFAKKNSNPLCNSIKEIADHKMLAFPQTINKLWICVFGTSNRGIWICLSKQSNKH